MRWMQEQSKYENIAYVALWGLLFAAPLLSLYVRTASDSSLSFNWQEVWVVWRQFGIYLLLFLVHNFILAPLLIYRHKRWHYFVLTAIMMVAFTAYQCSHRPDGMQHRHRRHQPSAISHQPSDFDHQPSDIRHQTSDFSPPPSDFDHEPPAFDDMGRPGRKPDMKPGSKRRERRFAPVFVGQHDIMSVVVLILMCGMNLGLKNYFKTRGDQRRLAQLEQQNLSQQLEYLKYQINPHFFMNTLNNIHALVDIDPAKAQETILELSKMMRFVLYEGDKQGVPLTKEFEFIRTYIHLMNLRYTDKVRISVDLPGEAPDKTIPPLMLISFIENAFKHGISYQHESFVEVAITLSPQPASLHFTCRNSKSEKPNQEKGGVGLANVRKRLNLLYGNNYTLNIQDENDSYYVELNIPLS